MSVGSGHMLVTALLLATSIPAYAQLNRAYVSPARGSDANGCSHARPCRSIDRAISLSNDGGEVVILDSGGFSRITIDRSISIVAAPSTFAGVISDNQYAVSADVPGGRVALRGLTLTGAGAFFGITAGLSILHLEDLIVTGFESPASVHVEQLNIERATFRDNRHGIQISGHAASGRATIRNSFLHAYGNPLTASDGAQVHVLDTTVTGGCHGLVSVAGAVILLKSVNVIHTGTALFVREGGRFDVASSDIALNEYSAVDFGDGGGIVDNGGNTVRENEHHNSFVPFVGPTPYDPDSLCDSGAAWVPPAME